MAQGCRLSFIPEKVLKISVLRDSPEQGREYNREVFQ